MIDIKFPPVRFQVLLHLNKTLSASVLWTGLVPWKKSNKFKKPSTHFCNLPLTLHAWLALIWLVSISFWNESTWPSLIETKYLILCICMRCVQVKEKCVTLYCGQGPRFKLSLKPSGTWKTVEGHKVARLQNKQSDLLLFFSNFSMLSSPHLHAWSHRVAVTWLANWLFCVYILPKNVPGDWMSHVQWSAGEH